MVCVRMASGDALEHICKHIQTKSSRDGSNKLSRQPYADAGLYGRATNMGSSTYATCACLRVRSCLTGEDAGLLLRSALSDRCSRSFTISSGLQSSASTSSVTCTKLQ